MTNKETVLKFFEVLNERDMDAADKLLTAKTEFYFPRTKPIIGKNRILKFLSIFFRRYPELFFTVAKVILQKDQAAVHWTNRGVSRRQEPYENEGVTILEMKEGRIVYISDFFKNTEKW